MCTVTLFPVGKSDFVLTSNRDEAPNRVSLAPAIYDIDGVKMMFPKDKLAGGSWIGVSEKKRVLCVLNGGFTRHGRKDKYRLSRGVVMKDLLTCNDIEKAVANYELHDIEPFTLVIVDWVEDLRFFELVWDGNNKHFQELPLEPKIWSSSTLYNDKMKSERQLWFSDFLAAKTLTKEHVLDFHQNTQKSNTEYGIVMDRLFVKTTSITQVAKQEQTVRMNFNNLQEATKSLHHFELLQEINE
jgi:hypothetical protein